jgi:hypothetical protein
MSAHVVQLRVEGEIPHEQHHRNCRQETIIERPEKLLIQHRQLLVCLASEQREALEIELLRLSFDMLDISLLFLQRIHVRELGLGLRHCE